MVRAKQFHLHVIKEPSVSLMPGAPSSLAIVTVTYHPDHALLRAQMAGLPKDSLWILVDNGSSGSDLALLKQIAAERPETIIIANNTNLGLAAALNKGVDHAVDAQKSHVLLLDQDSIPHPNARL